MVISFVIHVFVEDYQLQVTTPSQEKSCIIPLQMDCLLSDTCNFLQSSSVFFFIRHFLLKLQYPIENKNDYYLTVILVLSPSCSSFNPLQKISLITQWLTRTYLKGSCFFSFLLFQLFVLLFVSSWCFEVFCDRLKLFLRHLFQSLVLCF